MSKKDFKTDIQYRIYKIKHFAKKHNWTLVSDNLEMLKFINQECAILKIHYYNLNVQTSLSHPTWGPTLMLREGDFTEKIIESIFQNPRAHMPEQIKSEYKNICNCGAKHSMESLYDNNCNYCLKPIKI